MSYKWIARYKNHGVEGLERKTRKFSAEFKEQMIKDMRENHLSLRETANKYNVGVGLSIKNWERIYLTEGLEGLREERRGKSGGKADIPKGRKSKAEQEKDLIAEIQSLRMENDYIRN